MKENKKSLSPEVKKLLPVVIVAGVILMVVSFYAGMKFAGSKNPTGNFAGANVQRFGQATGGANAVRRTGSQNGGVVNGDLLSKDDKSITVKLRDGGSKVVFYNTNTKIMRSTTGTIADLLDGQGLMILGSANPDGSVNAESIQVRPAFSSSTIGGGFQGRPPVIP